MRVPRHVVAHPTAQVVAQVLEEQGVEPEEAADG